MTQQQLEELKKKIERASEINRSVEKFDLFVGRMAARQDVWLEQPGKNFDAISFAVNEEENPVLFRMIIDEAIRRRDVAAAELEAL